MSAYLSFHKEQNLTETSYRMNAEKRQYIIFLKKDIYTISSYSQIIQNIHCIYLKNYKYYIYFCLYLS